MSAATVTMTPEQARKLHAAYAAELARLSRMSKVALAIEERRLMAEQGRQRIYGGPYLKDEFISSVLELRGYQTDRLNEAVHVLHHDVVWPDCPHCIPPCEACIGRECHCDHPARPMLDRLEANPAVPMRPWGFEYHAGADGREAVDRLAGEMGVTAEHSTSSHRAVKRFGSAAYVAFAANLEVTR